MPVHVIHTKVDTRTDAYPDWDTACGVAVRNALEGEDRVTIQDVDGRMITVQAFYVTGPR